MDEPGVSAKEMEAETIIASEARPLESEISLDPNAETETQFLNRWLLIQREGGWGSHLNAPIMERIKKINGIETPSQNADEVENRL